MSSYLENSSRARFDLGGLGAVVATVGGVLTGERLGAGSGSGAIVAAAVLVLGALLSSGRCRHGFILAVLGLTAVTSTQRALNGLDSAPLASVSRDYSPARVTGVLVGDPRPGQYVTRAIVRVTNVEPQGPVPAIARRRGLGRVIAVASGNAASRLRLLVAGESVTLKGRLAELEGSDRRWRWQHVAMRLDASDFTGLAPTGDWLLRVANPLRSSVLGGIDTLPLRERALVRGFLVGDVREMDGGTVEAFRAAGLSHLLAVSGANVAFVLGIAGPVLTRFGLRGRFLGGLMVLVVFGAMTRWEPSVLRAVTMAGVAQLAVYLGRPVDGQRALILAVVALVLVDPFLVHSVGFMLSCAASAAILTWSSPIARRLPGPRFLAEPVAVTAAAQIGVAPVLLPVFGSIPLVALPANVLVAPVIGALTTWGLCTGPIISALRWIAPGLASVVAGPLQIPTQVLAGYVMGVANLAARTPFGLGMAQAGALLAVVLVGVAARRLSAGPRSLRGHGISPARRTPL